MILDSDSDDEDNEENLMLELEDEGNCAFVSNISSFDCKVQNIS